MREQPLGPPLVKICGLRRREDVVMVDELGADFVGVLLTPGFSRSIDPRSVGRLLEGVRARAVAVLVDESADDARRKAEALDAEVIQLHGREPPEVLEALARPGMWTLWKAVRVRTVQDVANAVDEYRGLADGILLEGWKAGVVGGGGVRLELDAPPVRELFEGDQHLILAGGLTPVNVGAVIESFGPDVADVSSGVESVAGEKDPALVRQFISAARAVRPPIGVRPAGHEASR